MTHKEKMAEIDLGKGLKAIVDEEDHKYLAVLKWYPCKAKKRKDGSRTYYVQRPARPGQGAPSLFMHRQVMNAKKGDIVDHINGNGLDNRKINLRFVNHSQNAQNTRSNVSQFGFIGVHKSRPSSPFRVQATLNGGRYTKSGFLTAMAAAIHYDEVVLKWYGPDSMTNLKRGLLKVSREG